MGASSFTPARACAAPAAPARGDERRARSSVSDAALREPVREAQRPARQLGVVDLPLAVHQRAGREGVPRGQ
jgi:hypothetical protein